MTGDWATLVGGRALLRYESSRLLHASNRLTQPDSKFSSLQRARQSIHGVLVLLMESRQNMRVQDADSLERLQAEFEAAKHSPSARTSNLRSPARPSVQHPSRATAAAAAAPTPQPYQPLMVLGSIVEKGVEHLNAGSEDRRDGAKPPQPTAQSFPQARHRSAGRVSQPPLLPRLHRLSCITCPYSTHLNSVHFSHMQPFEQTCTNIPNVVSGYLLTGLSGWALWT